MGNSMPRRVRDSRCDLDPFISKQLDLSPIEGRINFGHPYWTMARLKEPVPLDPPLCVAAKHGDEASVRRYLLDGQEVNCLDNKGRPPLVLAVKNKNLDTVKVLLEGGADCDQMGTMLSGFTRAFAIHPHLYRHDSMTCTPLYVAAALGYLDILKVLLKHGAGVNVIGGVTAKEIRGRVITCHQLPLHVAVQRGQAECVRALIAAKADVDCMHFPCQSPLTCAIQSEDCSMEIVRQLLDSGASLTVETDGLRLQAGLSLETGEDEIVRTRVDALHVAARGGRPDCVRVLLDRGADPNERDENGQTPLLRTLLYSIPKKGEQVSLEVCRLLIQYGTNLGRPDHNRLATGLEASTPLEVALVTGNVWAVDLILATQEGASAATRQLLDVDIDCESDAVADQYCVHAHIRESEERMRELRVRHEEPQVLKAACRSTVRAHMRSLATPTSFMKIRDLPLQPVIIDYLFMKELDYHVAL